MIMPFQLGRPSTGRHLSGETEWCHTLDIHELEQLSAEKHGNGKTILIVEDDEGISEMLALTLEQETSYQPLVVSSGQEALRVVQAVQPTLLLLDYQLPDMTGIEVYDRLHARKEFTAVPAIVMSANMPRHELSKRHLIKLEKPFEIDTLVDLVETVCGDYL
jgi:CheY-like chemotaxis protein